MEGLVEHTVGAESDRGVQVLDQQWSAVAVDFGVRYKSVRQLAGATEYECLPEKESRVSGEVDEGVAVHVRAGCHHEGFAAPEQAAAALDVDSHIPTRLSAPHRVGHGAAGLDNLQGLAGRDPHC